MASKSGNLTKVNKISIAEELVSLIEYEEYPEDVEAFGDRDYLNKNGVAALKKMTSGKWWADNRKFTNRQNSVIVNGLFTLFGVTLGKPASVIRAEVCDYFLDPDNKELRDNLRRSLCVADKKYSKWIARLSDDNYPCDEFGLYLLCHTYKRHALVILSSQVWCTFKQRNMSLFEKICKADHILAWTGEDRYLEIRLLHVKGGMGNLMEWQLLADSVEHIHEKRLTSKKQSRPRRATTSTSCVIITEEEPISPQTTRRGTKRDSKIKIDYKQYHREGVTANKVSKTEKILPQASGPSASRLAAQEMIRGRKNTSCKPLSTSPAVKLSNRKATSSNLLPQNGQTSQVATVKKPTVINTNNQRKKENITAKTVPAILGSPMSDDNFLPDLVAPSILDRATLHTAREVVTTNASQPLVPIISLVSPPAIVRTLDPPAPHPELTQLTSNWNDLQSTLEFSNDSTHAKEATDLIISESELSILEQSDREVVTLHNTLLHTTDVSAFSQSPPAQSSTPKSSERRQVEHID